MEKDFFLKASNEASLWEAVHGAETIQSAFKRTACHENSQPILSAIMNYLTCFLAFPHLLHFSEQFILKLNLMSCTTFSEWNSITTTNQVLLVCWWQSLHRYIYKQIKDTLVLDTDSINLHEYCYCWYVFDISNKYTLACASLCEATLDIFFNGIFHTLLVWLP